MTTKPQTWNYTAGLSKAPNLWEGLHSLWVFEDGVSIRDLISGQVHTYAFAATESITTEGRIIVPGSTERFTLDHPIPRADIDANGISVFVRALYSSTSPNFRQLFSLESTASSGNQQYISMRTANTGDMSVRRRINETLNSESTVGRVDDTPWSGIISHDGNITAEIRLNGERFTRVGAADATVSYELDQLEFGQAGGALAIAAIWNRQLSAAEFDQLETDPYCMIRPDPMLGVPLAALMPLGGAQFLPYNKLNISLGLSL